MSNNPVRSVLRINETVATLIAAEEYLPLAENEIRFRQEQIRDYIRRDPRFRHALEPLEVFPDAPDIVRRMSAAAGRIGVGPMAAVAGAIAQCTVDALLAAGCRHVVMDNGGDVVLKIDRPVVVGIFTGPAKIRNIGLHCEPRPDPFSICTSSGTVGHSLSFGRADAATVIAADGFLADAAATALGNRIRQRHAREIAAAIAELLLEGIETLFVVADDRLGMGGIPPKIVRVPVAGGLVSQAREVRHGQ